MKFKACSECSEEGDVMYRVQTQKGKTWRFVCPSCLPACQQRPQYRYGGTWKGYRH